MDQSYPYATRAILSNPKRYSRSPYNGLDFLSAWKADRGAAKDSLPPPETPPPPSGSNQQSVNDFIKTRRLLEDLFATVTFAPEPPDEAFEKIDALVKKFEVTKRVHEAYTANFLAIDKEAHRDLSLYLQLAEVVEAAHSRTGALPYLNVLLKIMDTLCALHTKLSDSEQSRLAWLIDREDDHVRTLADPLGIEP